MNIGHLKGQKETMGCVQQSSDYEENLHQALKAVDWKNSLNQNAPIYIKPNFTAPIHRPGVTTCPSILEALVDALKEVSSEVVIVESDGGNNSFKAEDSFRGHGVDSIVKRTGAKSMSLSKCDSIWISETVAGRRVKVQVPKFVVEEPFSFVSLAALKIHAMTSVTLTIKNLWGCVPNPMRVLYHSDLSRKLALLMKIWNPTIAIIDGTYGLDEHGPMFGAPRKMDLLIASNNPVVADAIGASIMGYRPRDIHHIRVAEDEGLGTTDLSQVALEGNWQEYRQCFSLKRTTLDYLSFIPFHNSVFASILFDSPFSALARRMVDIVRTEDEKEDISSYIV